MSLSTFYNNKIKKPLGDIVKFSQSPLGKLTTLNAPVIGTGLSLASIANQQKQPTPFKPVVSPVPTVALPQDVQNKNATNNFDLQGADFYRNIVATAPDMNLKKAAQGWLDRHDPVMYEDIVDTTIPSPTTDDWSSYMGGGSTGGMGGGSSKNDTNINPFTLDSYQKEAFGNPGMSREDLYRAAYDLNNQRNRVQSGMEDPYKLGVKSGIPFSPEQLSNIEKGSASTYDPAINDVYGRLRAQEDMMKLDKQYGTGSGSGYTYGSNPALDVILGSLPMTRDQKNSVIMAVQSGQDPSTVIKNKAKDIMGATTATALSKNEDAIDSIKQLDSLLKQYYAKGGQSGLFKGSYEKVLNSLGETKNPELAGVNASIQLALQKYRNAVSGTAYSVQEGREIGSIFPSIRNGEILNDVVTKSQANYLQSVVDSTYSNVLGKDVYNTLKQVSTDNVQSGGDVITKNGVNYKLNPSDGKYYPFNGVGGDTNKASVNGVDEALRKIGQIESSGNYKAIGPVVSSGTYAGQKALGKYQMMPGNIPGWSQEALGRVVTPSEFLNNPKIQDDIARFQFNKIYKKYGNWDDVASVWFTGRPKSQGGNSKDVLGTTGLQYVNNFNRA